MLVVGGFRIGLGVILGLVLLVMLRMRKDKARKATKSRKKKKKHEQPQKLSPTATHAKRKNTIHTSSPEISPVGGWLRFQVPGWRHIRDLFPMPGHLLAKRTTVACLRMDANSKPESNDQLAKEQLC